MSETVPVALLCTPVESNGLATRQSRCWYRISPHSSECHSLPLAESEIAGHPKLIARKFTLLKPVFKGRVSYPKAGKKN
ncbi:hypothetical protein ABIC09_007365 [Bradyrhizobium sp. S3.12.5]